LQLYKFLRKHKYKIGWLISITTAIYSVALPRPIFEVMFISGSIIALYCIMKVKNDE